MRRSLLLVLACGIATTVGGAPDHYNPKRLTGTYSIGTTSLTDPSPGDPTDALLRLYLTGEAAKDLYNTLRVPSARDQCFDDGSLTKTLGEVMCTRHPKGAHECWIGIDLKKKALANAFVC